MSMMGKLREGFRFFLMSLGISTPVKKTPPKPASKPNPGSQ